MWTAVHSIRFGRKLFHRNNSLFAYVCSSPAAVVGMMNGTSAKKHCSDASEPVTIGTHDGAFHCDEVLACWMLKQLPQYKDASIVRTRDPAKLSACEIVVDVGAVYDPEKLRFDHHQRLVSTTTHVSILPHHKFRVHSSCLF